MNTGSGIQNFVILQRFITYYIHGMTHFELSLFLNQQFVTQCLIAVHGPLTIY